MLERFLGWWFAPALWIDGLRHANWNTEPVARFRDEVWRKVAEAGRPRSREAFILYADPMKWQREWRWMYLRTMALKWAWYAALALGLAPLVAAPLALVWWLAQHVTVGWH